MLKELEKSRLEILREYAAYDRTKPKEHYPTEYVLGGEVPLILTKYNYASYLANIPKDSDAVAFRLLDFVCDHFRHDGYVGLGERSITGLIEFCETHEGKTNCRGLAMLLASLLRLNGIKARHITCEPYEDPFDDCHVVVDCLLPSGQRIMLDPTQRLYYKDIKGNYVSLRALRRMLIEEAELVHNPDASYNGQGFDAEANREYMSKNTLRFFRGTYYRDGVDDGERQIIELVPAGYDVEAVSKNAPCKFVYDEDAFWEMD